MVNHQFRLERRPEGSLVPSDLRYSEEAVRPPGPGQLLVQVLYLSVDPGLRGWLNPAPTFIAPVEVGDVIRAIGVGKVVEANGHNRFGPGDYVLGMLGAGDTPELLLQGYAWLEKEDIQACLVYAVRHQAG